MSDGTKAVLANLLTLSEAERAEVAEKLLASLEDHGPQDDQAAVDASWADEAERRSKAHREGKVPPLPGEEVMKRLFAMRGL